jgi:hypothetical protein
MEGENILRMILYNKYIKEHIFLSYVEFQMLYQKYNTQNEKLKEIIKQNYPYILLDEMFENDKKQYLQKLLFNIKRFSKYYKYNEYVEYTIYLCELLEHRDKKYGKIREKAIECINLIKTRITEYENKTKNKIEKKTTNKKITSKVISTVSCCNNYPIEKINPQLIKILDITSTSTQQQFNKRQLIDLFIKYLIKTEPEMKKGLNKIILIGQPIKNLLSRDLLDIREIPSVIHRFIL